MLYVKTALPDVYILEPTVYSDNRGYFMETYRKEDFDKHISSTSFIQDNQSKSTFGVLRGLHYQKGEWSQAKLVRVLQGRVIDVAVDLRRSSPTFGKHIMVELTEENQFQLFIPRGFAHGFLVLSDTAVFIYKVDNHYMPSAEASIRFDDPQLAIPWPLQTDQLLLSPKDMQAVPFLQAELFE